MWRGRTRCAAGMLVVCLGLLVSPPASAQGLGGAGTIQGTVTDPTGGVMQAVAVTITNPVSGFTRTATTDAAGRYVFNNLPPNPYHLAVTAQGFQTLERDVDVRTGVPITMDLSLALAGASSSVEVVGHNEDLLERSPTAHTDVDQTLIAKLPIESSAGGLNQVVTLASPGVVADSNGFFHPVGDHAQTQFSIDNQPITDQQSRLYSNQISQDAVQSMEVITGVAPAEYGDKSSLVVHIVTKSGLDQAKPTGSASFGYGSFTSPTGEVNIGGGSHRLGNFISLSGLRTDRFLDPPELEALHDTRKQRLVVRPIRLPSGDERYAAPQHSGGELGIRRAQHVRQDPADATPEDRHLQHRAGLLACDRLEHPVHGEWVRSSRPSDLHCPVPIPSTTRPPPSARIAGSRISEPRRTSQ